MTDDESTFAFRKISKVDSEFVCGSFLKAVDRRCIVCGGLSISAAGNPECVLTVPLGRLTLAGGAETAAFRAAMERGVDA